MKKLLSPVTTMQRLQLDERLRPLRDVVQAASPPPGGWLRTIRQALGMSVRDVARRTGNVVSTLAGIERAEADGTVTLNTLRRVADAMDCDLVYALVPRQTLQSTLINRAIAKATAEMSRVTHTMALEKQTPAEQAQRGMFDARVQELMAGSPRRLWEDD
jgi:predicted DNA-binding mobile mystery protein A